MLTNESQPPDLIENCFENVCAIMFRKTVYNCMNKGRIPTIIDPFYSLPFQFPVFGFVTTLFADEIKRAEIRRDEVTR